jgi:hypothetical protein
VIFDIAIVLTWLAAAYRAWILVSQPRTIWRTSFSVSIMIAAVAFTLYRFRMPLDELTGAWNLTGLVVRLLFAIGAAFLLIYLDALRMPTVSPRRVRIYLATAGVAVVALTTLWILAPVHDRPLDDLLPLAGHLSVVAYCLTFWGYLLTALLLTAWTCLAQGRTFRRADPARSVSLLLIGLSGVATVPVVALWTTSILLRHMTGVEPTQINATADALLPVPVLLTAIGVLSLLTVPYVSALLVAWWRWRQLEPLWAAMTERYPQVHLDLETAGGPLARAQTRVERAIIEIHDALRLARVDIASDCSADPPLVTVASALHRHGGRRSSDVLSRVDTRDAEIERVVALARSYRDASRQPA